VYIFVLEICHMEFAIKIHSGLVNTPNGSFHVEIILDKYNKQVNMTAILEKPFAGRKLIFKAPICPNSSILQLLNYQNTYGIQ